MNNMQYATDGDRFEETLGLCTRLFFEKFLLSLHFEDFTRILNLHHT